MNVTAPEITVSGALMKPRGCCVLFVWTATGKLDEYILLKHTRYHTV